MVLQPFKFSHAKRVHEKEHGSESSRLVRVRCQAEHTRLMILRSVQTSCESFVERKADTVQKYSTLKQA